MAKLPRHAIVSDPVKRLQKVEEAHRTVGHLLEECEDAALLVDVLCIDEPIVGASRGFFKLTGYSREDVMGSNCRMMLQGVPEVAISRSARKNIRDYCSMCQVEGLKDISEAHSMQPNKRRDGSIFMNLFMLGICMVRKHPYILSISLPLSEGLSVRLRPSEAEQIVEGARVRFKHIRDHLRKHIGDSDHTVNDEAIPEHLRQGSGSQPEFAFFTERLQDHCLLVNGGYTAIRREPEELCTNCLVFGNRPVKPSKEGLSFKVQVDEVTSSFKGLPILGFTRRRPADDPGLFPCVSRCLGCSVLIGACGEAFARDQELHYRMGFKPPPQDEVQTWSWQPGVSSSKRCPPVSIQAGDMLRCLYTRAGSIQLFANDELVLSFDTGRPLVAGADYYAVADVCLSVCSLTLMPSRSRTAEAEADLLPEQDFARAVSFEGRNVVAPLQGRPRVFRRSVTEIDQLVREVLVKKGIKDLAANCDFCVTIADPRAKDCPLIAVSEAFETMTGFTRTEALGVNCRFLNKGCDVDPEDLVNLRVSSETGAPFTAVLPNRRKSGELFLNLLDLRGLTVAQHPKTGEDLWFLVGIQADVTDLAEDEVPESHLAKMQWIADNIRAAVARELSEFAYAGAEEMNRVSCDEEDTFLMLDRPLWRPGASLGQRGLNDRPAQSLIAEHSPQGAGSSGVRSGLLVAESPAAGSGATPAMEKAAEPQAEYAAAASFMAFVAGGVLCLLGVTCLAVVVRRAAKV